MSQKLSSRQYAQLAFIETLPPQFLRIHAVLEQMATLQADDVVIRGFCRMLDVMKSTASQLSLNGIADSAGQMASMARRGGGLQMKVRGLREFSLSLKINYEAALKKASTPVPEHLKVDE